MDNLYMSKAAPINEKGSHCHIQVFLQISFEI